MRIRQVKPAFWSDSRLADLPEATRLFYIGLWMVADDAGWLTWDAAEVAKDLYGYETRARRERRVTDMFHQLIASGRVVEHPCGHVEIPTLTEHQRLSGATKQVRTDYQRHLRDCVPPSPAGIRGHLRESAAIGKERSGQSRNVEVSFGSAREAQTGDDDDLLAAFRRQGLPVEVAS